MSDEPSAGSDRPEGSNWGDFGPDDQLGRLNLITPEKVLQGIAEVQEGRSFCLRLPLDYPGGNVLNPRRHPPVLRPTLRNGRPNLNYRLRDDEPDRTDVISDDLVVLHTAVLDAVGQPRPCRPAVRCRRRRRARGGLLQRLSRRAGRGRAERRGRCRAAPAPSGPRAPRPRKHSASRGWRRMACRAGR